MTLQIVDWKRARHLASGILIAGALVAGGIVGNVLLLGSADHAGDPVGHLSVQVGSQAPPVTATPTLADEPTTPLTTTPLAPPVIADSEKDGTGRGGDEGRSPDD